MSKQQEPETFNEATENLQKAVNALGDEINRTQPFPWLWQLAEKIVAGCAELLRRIDNWMSGYDQ